MTNGSSIHIHRLAQAVTPQQMRNFALHCLEFCLLWTLKQLPEAFFPAFLLS